MGRKGKWKPQREVSSQVIFRAVSTKGQDFRVIGMWDSRDHNQKMEAPSFQPPLLPEGSNVSPYVHHVLHAGMILC